MRYHQKADGSRVPFTAEEEAQWDAMSAPPPPSPRELMRQTWITLPVAVRAAFANSYAQVNIALDQGDKELALYIIDMTVVPPELEAMKAQLRAMTEAVQ